MSTTHATSMLVEEIASLFADGDFESYFPMTCGANPNHMGRVGDHLPNGYWHSRIIDWNRPLVCTEALSITTVAGLLVSLKNEPKQAMTVDA